MASYDWNTLIAQADAGFEPLPSDEYDVSITSSEAKISTNGKLMFVVKMGIVGGPHNGRIIRNNFVVSPENPNAMSFFFQHMSVLGLDGNFFKANPTPEQVADALMGRSCRIKLGQKLYQGSVRNEVERVMPPRLGNSGPVGAPSAVAAMAPGGMPAAAAPAPAMPPPVAAATPPPVAAAVLPPAEAPAPAPAASPGGTPTVEELQAMIAAMQAQATPAPTAEAPAEQPLQPLPPSPPAAAAPGTPPPPAF